MNNQSPSIGTQSFTKFCPSCKLGNNANSVVCAHCGRSFDLFFARPGKINMEGRYAAPAKGLALYFEGSAVQVAIATDEEFVLGRKVEGDVEALIDFTYPNGFAMGISRRHAMICSKENGYVIIDLNSSNGTWLDGKILPPRQPIQLPSGGTIQLGRLKVVAIYNSSGNEE